MTPLASTRSTSRDQGRRLALMPSVRSTRIPSSPYRPTFTREVSPCTYPALPSLSPPHVPRSPLFWITPVWLTYNVLSEVKRMVGVEELGAFTQIGACWVNWPSY